MQFLGPFDVNIKHIAGIANSIADTLSRATQKDDLMLITQLQTEIKTQVKNAYKHDPLMQQLIEQMGSNTKGTLH